MKAPIFIVGRHRSGNTLMGNSLLSCDKFWGVYSEEDGHPGIAASEVYHKSLEKYRRGRFHQFSGIDGETPKEIINKAIENAGDRIYVDKTPDHLLYFREIKNDFADAKFIWMRRDLVDSAISNYYLQKKRCQKTGPKWLYLIRQAMYKKVSDRAGFEMKKEYFSDVLEVRFSDLINNHKETVESILNYLNISADYGGHPTVTNTSFKNDKPKINNFEKWIIKTSYTFGFIPIWVMKMLVRK